MKKVYDFKRKLYYEVETAIENSHVTFLLGPRKCGKTVCLKQLEAGLDNVVYVDMKSDFNDDDKRMSFINRAVASIANDDKIIYFIDEATYMALPDKEIAKIAGAYSEYVNNNTKFVFSGSQSKSLEQWGHIAFAGNASFVRGDFLTYPEWLAYKGTAEISEKTYLDYILNVRNFYDFNSTKEYLQGCLDETVISNRNAIEYIIGNDYDNIDVEILLDVLYASLVQLHNQPVYDTFSKSDALSKSIGYYFKTETSEVGRGVMENRALDVLENRYNSFKGMNALECKQALRFLTACGLVTVTYVSEELSVDPYITSKLLKNSSDLYTKPDIFKNFNVSINYPMFYIDLVREIFKEKEITEIPRNLLGSIVECHVKSMLPNNGSFIYRDEKGTEVDYVNVGGKAIEITVYNKKMQEVHLNILPDEYKKTLLTKDITDVINGIKRIPYYQFIYDQSEGRELVEALIKSQSIDKSVTVEHKP